VFGLFARCSTLAIMPSANQVPVKTSHSMMLWPKWVVLIALLFQLSVSPPPIAFSLGVGFCSRCATALPFVVGVAARSSLRAFLVVITTSFRDSARLPCLSSEVELALAYRRFCRLDLKDITVGSNWLTQRNSSTFRPYRITGRSLKQEVLHGHNRGLACLDTTKK
jgi:hypothetical protein